MITLELQPTFEEKLADFATQFVPDLVSNICRLAQKAQENPVILYLVNEWYENSKRATEAYRSAILYALENKQENFTESTMTRIYKDKAYSARDVLQEYFMNNAFEK